MDWFWVKRWEKGYWKKYFITSIVGEQETLFSQSSAQRSDIQERIRELTSGVADLSTLFAKPVLDQSIRRTNESIKFLQLYENTFHLQELYVSPPFFGLHIVLALELISELEFWTQLRFLGLVYKMLESMFQTFLDTLQLREEIWDQHMQSFTRWKAWIREIRKNFH